MIKKITAGVATLALSVGIISTTSAAELTQPSPKNSSVASINKGKITPLGFYLYKNFSIPKYYSSKDSIPTEVYHTETNGGYVYSGYLKLQNAEKVGATYVATFSGTLSCWVN